MGGGGGDLSEATSGSFGVLLSSNVSDCARDGAGATSGFGVGVEVESFARRFARTYCQK